MVLLLDQSLKVASSVVQVQDGVLYVMGRGLAKEQYWVGTGGGGVH